MKREKICSTILLILLFQTIPIYAQLSLINPPRENAFIARNVNTNKGTLTLKGAVTDPAYSALKLNIYQNHVLKNSYNFSFNYNLGITGFSQNIELVAGKFIYTLEYKLSGSQSYTTTIDGIMVGDAYLVQGQSNAVACNYVNANINYSAAYSDTFIKSFGSTLYTASAAINDTTWYRADGEKLYTKACIGQWPLVLAKTILDSFGIPVCIINGAVGGTYITQHVRTPGNSTDLNSIYGRLLYRVRKAGLENNIRGILYFQGESDGSNASLHDSLFKQVYSCWNQDFKGFKKLYVVQVRGKGCGLPSIQLREYQRQFGQKLSKCSVISANGLNNHDGCHYGFVNGYELLGKQIAALVSRDLYNGKIVSNIDPPNIKSCFYSNASQDEITLNMENSGDLIFADNLFQKIFVVEGDNTVSITNGFIRNNKVVLKLNKSSCSITGLTYNSDNGNQPWVKNKMNAGLISFYNCPIVRHQIQPYYTGCKQALISLGEDTIPGCKYLWKRLSTNQSYTSARIKVRGDSVEAFSLILTYGNTACKLKDTIPVYLSPDPVKVPELGKNDTICKGDTLVLKPEYFGFSQFKWSNGSVPATYQSFYNVSRTENILLTATSLKQCVYKDSVNIFVSVPILSMPEQLLVCAGSDTLLTAPAGFKTYAWNGQAGSLQYRSGEGLLVLEVSNNKGCKVRDTSYIMAFDETPPPLISVNACKNAAISVPRPEPFMAWYYQSVKIKDSLKVSAGNHYPIVLSDSNGCSISDTLHASVLPIPEFSLGSDTGICKGGKLILSLPYNMDEYRMNGVVINNPTVNVSASGIYIATVRNSYFCSYSDTIRVVEFPSPDLSIFRDTILCRDSSWKPLLRSDWKYIIDGAIVQDGYRFSTPGAYLLKAINNKQCATAKTLLIGQKECNPTQLHTTLGNSILFYPNPVDDLLNVNSSFETESVALLYDAEGRLLDTLKIQKGSNTLNLTQYTAGYYFIDLSGYHFKFIKN